MEEDQTNSDESEENVYSEESRKEYVESGEISPEEEAFMKGYEDADESEEKEEESKEEE